MEVIRIFKTIKNYHFEKSPQKIKAKLINSLDRNKNLKSKYKKYILEFIDTIIKSGSSYDFSLLYKNLKRLKIVVVPKLNNDKMAVYDIHDNTIYIDCHYISQLDNIIFHELFHFSSAKKSGKDYCTGFKKGTLFEAFNEGYTEVLTKRYFFYKAKHQVYLIERNLAELLEVIIGKDLMENIYSKADYLSLLIEFSKYTESQDETYKTLQNFGLISLGLEKNQFDVVFMECRKIVLVFIKAFINKCKGNVSLDEIEYFFQLIPLYYTCANGDVFNIITAKEADDFKKQCYELYDNYGDFSKRKA